jgi:hypothetical protein
MPHILRQGLTLAGRNKAMASMWAINCLVAKHRHAGRMEEVRTNSPGVLPPRWNDGASRLASAIRIANFDFAFNPKMKRSLVFDLAAGGFIAKHEDALFLARALQARAISRKPLYRRRFYRVIWGALLRSARAARRSSGGWHAQAIYPKKRQLTNLRVMQSHDSPRDLTAARFTLWVMICPQFVTGLGGGLA